MAFTYNATLLLGSSQTGLAATLRAALMDTAGTIHATLRDITTGFIEVGVGIYSWVSASIPTSYRGLIVFYTGTLGVASDFTGVTLKSASPVSPEEFENADVKTTSRAAPTDIVSGGAITTAAGVANANIVQINGAAASLDTDLTITNIAAGILDLTNGIETDVTLRQAMRGIGAVVVGLLPSGAGSGVEAFKGVGQASGGTTRVTNTVDSSGNRTAQTLNL